MAVTKEVERMTIFEIKEIGRKALEDQVRKGLESGLSIAQIANACGVAESTVLYAKKRLS